MNLGVLLDAALSALAVMMLFSLAASAINEFISDALMKLRGKTLEEAICRLLADKPAIAGATAPEKAERFFEDPDIRALMQGTRRPSAIEPRRYAVTVLKLLGRRDDLLRQAEDELRTAREAVLASLPAGLNAETVEQALAAVAARAEAFRTTFDREVAALEHEFNEAMDRATGWYLRRVRLNLFVIGLVMAVGANVDLLHYTDRLMTQASVRDKATIYSQMLGQGWAEKLGPTPDAEAARTDTLALPAQAALPEDLRMQVRDETERLLGTLEGLQVQIGWDCRPRNPGEWPNPIDRLGGCPDDTTYGLPSPSQIIGWIIIAFGVTLGAQFWFDLFKRMVNLRTAGLVGSKQQAEAAGKPHERG